MSLSIGAVAPDFSLPDTEGRTWSVAQYDGAPATVLVFTCNHCPYALAWHDRIVQVARDYAGRGVRVLAVNANDAERYPRDSFDAMKDRVAQEDWPMPYLHDATQEVAREYGAAVTPDVFVLDAQGRLRYRGAPDADYDNPGERAEWLRDALDAVLSGSIVERPETKPVGCSIKWKV
ncbi:MAG TPA: thioredoxin family protein [Mycobacteriales bacterium]|nr:thioredoxin family protein [Solirubrobacteraceae bacterium]HTR69813.1 thioredoxin family protein [Mycobacteriales bacterium]